ncbi:Hypothetical predicted protein [Mytilus galloprovincialis]|uniref:Fibronectin type-III domain-containing protein n=1 Tax=Mytilus galloprovincialis TaxID=29158 RepID=A0A8B6GZA3_MYTGA|nr:Hypothetical predicted protein [Mytilus galloprovincialis]
MTIAWFMNVPDECLSYELDHQPPGIDNLNVMTFSSKDVMEDVNGQRTYTLKNLLPETKYAFKLRSIYKDAKSHYSDLKTKQTLKEAPRKFDIIDWTDCSMTIEWFINVPDESISYELDHRPPGIDNLPVRTFSSKDVKEDVNGRRFYTLKNLLPETKYAFKLRYSYKDAKSHYSDSKTKQTLKEVLPDAIHQLSEEDKIRYNTLMQSSETEKRYCVRIMIVGKESAGKTCLLRRLLKEDITDVTSTDGVDIVVQRCKINIGDGKWTIGKGINDDKVGRIKRALNPYAEVGRNTQNMQVEETNNMNIRQGDEKSTNNKDITTNTKVRQENSNDTNESSSLFLPEDSINKVNLDNKEVTNESSSLVIPEDFTTDDKVNLDNKQNESSLLVMPNDLMSHVFSESTDNTLSNLYALCELWDFAGQKEFYATHQAFLTSSAVYLVVADMKDDISKQGLGQCFADFQNIGEYVDFWFDSIHCHRTSDKRARNGHFNPPIVLVFTGKDKYEIEADLKKRKKELNDQLDQVLGLQSKYHHLHKKCYLSNLTDTDEEFVKLQHVISETARKMDNWGNTFPLKWILLEHLIDINKNDGKNIINLNDMSKLAEHHDINILEKDELLLFLRFQHTVGNIIFFENIPDLIILKPQWLADAFRCLVSDRIDDSGLHHLKDWTLFRRQGKVSESLITELFKSKDGSQFSGQKNNLHKVMEKLDILVKIENSSYYIMPSQMPSSKFEDVCRNVGILTKNCKRTSWLCYKFKFLPPSFFNHISAWFIKQYIPSKVDSDATSFALYRGICVFDIDISGCEKILVTMSTDTIALQVVSFSEQEGFGSMCSGIHSEVTQLFEDIKQRYKVNISFKIHFKCSDGYYFKDTFEYDNLIIEKKRFCIQHKQMHRSDQILSPWMNSELKEIPDKAKINTTQDDQNPENDSNKEEAQDQTPVKTNLPVSVNLRQQINIKQSTNEDLAISSCIKTGNTLMFTDFRNNRLIICNSDGTDIHYIPLSYEPQYITEIDGNTVAVSCTYDNTILIIDISSRSVTSTINTRGNCYGISYNDNNLYVVISLSMIHVMDLTGKVIRAIPVPSYGIDDITVDRDRLVCKDSTSIYCCSLDGKVNVEI